MVTATQRVRRRLEKASTQSRRGAFDESSESDSSDEILEWIGEPLNRDTFLRRKPDKIPREGVAAGSGSSQSSNALSTTTRRATRGSGLSNVPYFGGFRKGGITYTLGDTVLLRNEQYSKKWEHAHVAQILALWETEDGGFEGDFRWFHQAEDIDRLRKHQRKGNFPERLEAGEIVYSLDDDKNDVSTVVAKCEIIGETEWRTRFGQAEAILTDSAKGLVWFCRGIAKRMSGYHAIEWRGNQEMMALKEDKETRPHPKTAAHSSQKRPLQERAQPQARVPPLKSKRRAAVDKTHSESEPDTSFSSSGEKEDSGSDSDASEKPRKKTAASGRKKHTPAVKMQKIKSNPATTRKTKTLTIQAPITQRIVSATAPRTDFEYARSRLHVKAVPDSLPCREDEFMEIQEHLESALEEGTGSCIYISGVPGTGKTATVHEVIRSLQAKADEGEISPFQFVEINGMKVTEPSYAYVLLWMALSNQKVTANHALQLLEKQFSTPGPRRLPCVVLMDELDLLVTSKQTVMYNFFEWPNWQHSRLIVVAVANTMDLPERMLHNKVSSRLGLTRINFQPYTYQQLVTIVESRLEGIKAFRREAIEFAARKVGAVSGDARRALDICRRAVEIVESNAQKADEQRRRAAEKNPSQNQGSALEAEQVSIRIVDQAIKEMFASPNVRLIQTASLHQKLFLVALTSRLRRLGLAEVEFSEVAHAHLQMCRLHNLEPPMLSDLSAICASLGSCRCLLVESGKQDIHQRVRLSVSEEDVIMALKADPLFKRLLDTLPSAPAS
ncbi:Origin recognition complex, subunit 1 [Mortierella claussenii]|nr:Origin recognition complex, subunit 1 [Mortierella claussenii]